MSEYKERKATTTTSGIDETVTNTGFPGLKRRLEDIDNMIGEGD